MKIGYEKKAQDTIERFGFQWNLLDDRFGDGLFTNFSKTFEGISPFIKKEDFNNKVVLDAGCGMGKVVDIAAREKAAIVVGADISSSVYVARKKNLNNSNALILQADLNKLPLKIYFDIITAFGVLHHTPNPRRSFLNLVNYLKPGGKIEILLYAKENSRLAMRIVNLLRRIMYRCGNKLRYRAALVINIPVSIFIWLCRWGFKIFNRYFRTNRGGYILFLYDQGFAYRQAVIFDFLSTPIIYFFTQDEIREWFREGMLVKFNIKKRNDNTWCAYGEKGL